MDGADDFMRIVDEREHRLSRMLFMDGASVAASDLLPGRSAR